MVSNTATEKGIAVKVLECACSNCQQLLPGICARIYNKFPENLRLHDFCKVKSKEKLYFYVFHRHKKSTKSEVT